ncbi:fructokinase [Crocosphaera subtropica ATCC 51142]|uniref:Fructokinase n=1 Tax=Crocosphaera subtropica (strain ATCC 51142 / BH68) TaxID=43989 RepID=B1WRS5_CROS5|nr:carbohydrate kinase [Crocosphaera subtropica]ACB53516.1 fructokinase [Crocosphaera subtropica ATCC 51142]
MNNPQILCMGEILFDCLANQLGKELEEVTSWTAYPGGAPANVACALIKLGVAAAFIGCIGEDKPGDELVDLLETIGVNITGIQRHPTAITRQVYVTRSLTGERNFAGFGDINTEEFADTQLEAKQLKESLFTHANYLVIGTLELAYSNSKEAIFQAIDLAKKHQLKIFVDINWRPVFWPNLEQAKPLILQILKEADLIKCSQEEANWLWSTEDPRNIAQTFPKIKGILVTLAEKGCHYYLGKNQGTVEGFSVEVVDTTGAGDSFVAGFLAQCCLYQDKIFNKADIAKQAIIYSNAVGALTTTKLGAIAAQPTQEEVETFLKNN